MAGSWEARDARHGRRRELEISAASGWPLPYNRFYRCRHQVPRRRGAFLDVDVRERSLVLCCKSLLAFPEWVAPIQLHWLDLPVVSVPRWFYGIGSRTAPSRGASWSLCAAVRWRLPGAAATNRSPRSRASTRLVRITIRRRQRAVPRTAGPARVARLAWKVRTLPVAI